jgi:hypothetical protein
MALYLGDSRIHECIIDIDAETDQASNEITCIESWTTAGYAFREHIINFRIQAMFH